MFSCELILGGLLLNEQLGELDGGDVVFFFLIDSKYLRFYTS